MTDHLTDTNVGNIEYIRREDALECVTYDVEYTTEQIKGLPSADVVPVVRCKDCLFFTTEKLCCRPEGLIKASEDAFCSYGERREE